MMNNVEWTKDQISNIDESHRQIENHIESCRNNEFSLSEKCASDNEDHFKINNKTTPTLNLILASEISPSKSEQSKSSTRNALLENQKSKDSSRSQSAILGVSNSYSSTTNALLPTSPSDSLSNGISNFQTKISYKSSGKAMIDQNNLMSDYSNDKYNRYGFKIAGNVNGSYQPKSRQLKDNTLAPNNTLLDLNQLRARETKWLHMLNKWDKSIRKNQEKVKSRCIKGLPLSLRGKIWTFLTGSYFIYSTRTSNRQHNESNSSSRPKYHQKSISLPQFSASTSNINFLSSSKVKEIRMLERESSNNTTNSLTNKAENMLREKSTSNQSSILFRNQSTKSSQNGNLSNTPSIQYQENNENTVTFELLLEQHVPDETSEQIERDLHRQFPEHELFRQYSTVGTSDLRRILRAYAVYNPRVGYCQGQGPVASTLLMHMTAEEAFWTMAQIIDIYGFSGYYSEGLISLKIDFLVLNACLKKFSKSSYMFLTKHQICPELFMTDWFMCAFARQLPWICVLRLWDLLFLEGPIVLFKASILIIDSQIGSPKIQRRNNDLMEIMDRLKKTENYSNYLLDPDEFILRMNRINLTEHFLQTEYKKILKSNPEWLKLAEKNEIPRLKTYSINQPIDNSHLVMAREQRIKRKKIQANKGNKWNEVSMNFGVA